MGLGRDDCLGRVGLNIRPGLHQVGCMPEDKTELFVQP